jgi:hypothetical protein
VTLRNCFTFLILVGILCTNLVARSAEVDQQERYKLRLHAPRTLYKLAYDQLNKRYLVISRDSLWVLSNDHPGWQQREYALNEFDKKMDFRQLVVLTTSSRVYLVLNSGGYVYEIAHDSIKKLDKSSNFRTQYGSSKFIVNDTIISYSGYGHWSFQPFFTYFDPKSGEWEMWELKTEDPLPVARAYQTGFYNPSTHDFYILGGYAGRYTAHKPVEHDMLDEVWKINMTQRKWEKLGSAHPAILQLPFTYWSIYKEKLLWYNVFQRSINKLDFTNNISSESKMPEETLYNFATIEQPAINETQDEILYATLSEDPEIRIMPMSSILADKHTDIAIYSNTWKKWIQLVAVLVLLLLGLFGFKKYRIYARESHKVDFYIKQRLLKYKKIRIYLDEVELKCLIHLASDLKYHNLIELFGIIELENSTMDSIYKHRKQIFRSINDKVNFAIKGEHEFILTRKNPADNRMIEVKINEDIVRIHG